MSSINEEILCTGDWKPDGHFEHLYFCIAVWLACLAHNLLSHRCHEITHQHFLQLEKFYYEMLVGVARIKVSSYHPRLLQKHLENFVWWILKIFKACYMTSFHWDLEISMTNFCWFCFMVRNLLACRATVTYITNFWV